MFTKWINNKNKVILIFLTFIFLSTSIFSVIQVQKYNKIIDNTKFELGRSYVDFDIQNIIIKFTKYRNDEFIKNMDFSNEIKSAKENDKNQNEESIQNIKEDIKTKKKELTDESSNFSKEKLAEEIKKLDEEEKQRIEEINTQFKKTDGDYKKEFIQMELDKKESIQERIKNIDNFKYLIVDNKNGEFETNSSYSRSDIEGKFINSSKYALKLSSENKTYVTSKEYVDGKSVDLTNNKLQNIKEWIKGKDVTLYLWVPNELWKNNDMNKLHNYYFNAAIISVALFSITLILLFIIKNKVQGNYNIYDKIPIDLALAGFLVLSILYVLKSGAFYIGGMFWGYNAKYLNPYIFISGAGVIGSILVTYVEFISKQSLKEAGEKSVLVKFIKEVKSLLEVKNILFKLSLVLILIILEIIFASNSYFMLKRKWIIIPIVLTILDLALFFMMFKKLIYFNVIIEGTKKITSGDLSLVLDEKGNGNLSELAHNINNMKVGLKNSLEKEMRSERLKSELITNVSHDLKTPLTSIINYVDLLKKEKLTPDKANDYVEILDRKSKRLKNLVEDLFEASKAASGAMDLNIEKIEITELIKQTLAEFEDKILSSALNFKVNLGKEKVYVMGDGRRTYRVFENLVQNALKYSMKHSRVYVDLIEDEKTIQFVIKNMSCYEMNFNADEIAERFTRGDVSRNTEGSGLGLAIAKSIMELQSGALKIEIDGDLFKVRVIFKK